jgi:hypothetical protein
MRTVSGSFLMVVLLVFGVLASAGLGSRIEAQNLSTLGDAEKLMKDIQSLRGGDNNTYNQTGATGQSSSEGIDNEATTGVSPTGEMEEGTDKGRKDLSGHYSNPDFGILDFVIPDGWYASETFEGQKRLYVEVQPGTNQERLDKLTQIPAGPGPSELVPKISVGSLDKEENRQATNLLEENSALPVCTSMVPNSTATINGKLFRVSTMECKTFDNTNPPNGTTPQNSTSTDILKTYQFDAEKTIYTIELDLPTQDFLSSYHRSVDINKYTPYLETVANSLKLK